MPQEARTGLPEKPKPAEPFAYADWTWLNGTPRNKDVVWDSKFFTPEIRFDTHLLVRVSTIREMIPWAGRAKFSGRTKSRWSKSASAATSTGKTFAAGS